MDYGHWQYPGDFNPEEWFGFIYRIIDTDTGREYLGKKQFGRHLKKKVKTKAGGTMNRRVTKESDWRKYTSSSIHINAAIVEKGKDKFVFLIESLHKSKAGLHYAEVEIQVNEDVLRSRLPNGERRYYNGMIGNIKFIPPEDNTEERTHRISKVAREFQVNNDHYHYSTMLDEEKQRWSDLYRINGRNPTAQ